MRTRANASDGPASAARPEPLEASSHAFPKSVRLTTPADYQAVFADASKFANRHWTFIVRVNHHSLPRLGLAISKKQLPKAVCRNRVKRLAREVFRQQKSSLSGYDIVVLGRRGMTEHDNATLIKSFEHLVRKIRRSGLKDASASDS
ncbi:ribonuclease P protein component [Thiomicrospira sp. WB1]|jgi:ribonuclease P protein component|uniref:ribonuclease P protein component n=1 Tax=Thiomicrospira sp. WB1 TaxID=1685380 RepID=UPI00074A63D5|nr:ribonuclease P protein component [Thiomicrospira sp. WB1]KUJ72350.1 ribonuclease P protein component [Thiomicrospira sp. WB1]